MDKASAWSRTKGMRFSSTKTETIIFSRTKYKTPRKIVLHGVPLAYTDVVKYLGVYIDAKLLWTDHVNIKLKKAKKALMAIVRVCHPTWGSPRAAQPTTGNAVFYQCSPMDAWSGTGYVGTLQFNKN